MVQWLEGTALYFRFGCAVFILLATFTFNTAGGLTRASGAYVFFYSTLVVIVGVCYKAFLGEPGQSNLSDPRTTIEVYVGGITAMLAAVLVSRRFRRKSGLLNVMKESQMYRASVGCILFGIAGGFIIALLGESALRLQSAFDQLNQLPTLGIVIGVMYEIRRSGGTRSLNLFIIIGALYTFFMGGIIAFSKQGLLLPLLCWLLPVCALRFRLSWGQVATCLLGGFFIFYYMVPYAQYGRRFRGDDPTVQQTFRQQLAISTGLLEHLDETRKLYNDEQSGGGYVGYYNSPQGFWDRLQFLFIDDRLITVTDQKGSQFGLVPIEAEIENAVPRIFWPNKPTYNFGNLYAHEAGLGLSEEDTTTGISFSPTAEAYHIAKWTGVLVIAPLLWFLLFVIYDSLFGDVRDSPWGLLAIGIIAHAAPEGQLTGVVHLITFGSEIFIFCALFATWVAPVLATTVLGPDRRRATSQIALQPTLGPRTQN